MPLLHITGEVDRPCAFDFAGLAALPEQADDVGTLLPGREGGGVWLRALLAAAVPRQMATHITLTATEDTFSASVPLAAVADRGVVVYRVGAEPLPRIQEGPVRFYIVGVEECNLGEVDACANVKYLNTIRLTVGPGEDTRQLR